MKSLNLDHINARSPYIVWRTEDEYRFYTDYDIAYSVIFDPESLEMPIRSYWLNLYNRSHKNSPNDLKIQYTLFCIIEEFFKENPDILLYMCDTANNQQAMRSRLFFRWFKNYSKKDDYLISTTILKDEDEENYIAIIIPKKHPYAEEVLTKFEEEVNMFRENKP